MNHDETVAVLAHEIGHWKKKHMLKTIVMFEVFSFIGLYLSFKIIQSDVLVTLFHIHKNTLFVKFTLLAFLAEIISLPFTPCVSYFMRRHERQADKASYELTKPGFWKYGERPRKTFKGESRGSFYPHPLYVMMYYSHPPILERIRYLEEFLHTINESVTERGHNRRNKFALLGRKPVPRFPQLVWTALGPGGSYGWPLRRVAGS